MTHQKSAINFKNHWWLQVIALTQFLVKISQSKKLGEFTKYQKYTHGIFGIHAKIIKQTMNEVIDLSVQD